MTYYAGSPAFPAPAPGPVNPTWPPAPAPAPAAAIPAPLAPSAPPGGPRDGWEASPALEMAQMLSALHQAVGLSAYRDGAPAPPQTLYPPQPYAPVQPQPHYVPQAYVQPVPQVFGQAVPQAYLQPAPQAPPVPAEPSWGAPTVGPGFKRPGESNYPAPRAAEPRPAAWSPPPAPTPAAPPRNHASGEVGERAVQFAKQFLGTPYVWGGESPRGFDCSGLMQYVYDKLGVDIPRVAKDQARAGRPVDPRSLVPGDLVYFRNTGSRTGITHIGMYVGDNKFIHAPKTGDVVKVSDLGEDYYQDHFAGATRVA